MQEPPRPVFCLIIEDNPLVGLDLADALTAKGYYIAGPFSLGKAACEWLGRFTPDVAVVDLSLRDGSCLEAICELQAQAIPFIVYTGCPFSQNPIERLANVTWLEKPASPEAIESALRELLSSS